MTNYELTFLTFVKLFWDIVTNCTNILSILKSDQLMIALFNNQRLIRKRRGEIKFLLF